MAIIFLYEDLLKIQTLFFPFLVNQDFTFLGKPCISLQLYPTQTCLRILRLRKFW